MTFWVNYTEATYRNIRLTSSDGKVLFEGTPGDVKIPAVAPQWTAFGEGGKYRLVKDDAVNMRYSQEITAGKTEAGIFQGPLDVDGEDLVGSIYAKGEGELTDNRRYRRSLQTLYGNHPDILKAVKELHPTCLRWPGGGYVAQYDWKWGIGPQEKRERWAHWMWMDYDQNCFGTDEFIRFCREVNSEPFSAIVVLTLRLPVSPV